MAVLDLRKLRWLNKEDNFRGIITSERVNIDFNAEKKGLTNIENGRAIAQLRAD